jgi:hypothetical protein
MYYGRKLSYVCGYTRELDFDMGKKRIIFSSITFQNLV